MDGQPSEEEGRCDLCAKVLAETVHECLDCKDNYFCVACFEFARTGGHAGHQIIQYLVQRAYPTQSIQSSVIAESLPPSERIIVPGQTDLAGGGGQSIALVDGTVEIAQSLQHLQNAELYYSHGNLHTSAEATGPHAEKRELIREFQHTHYPKDLLEILRKRVLTRGMSELVERVKAKVKESEVVKLSPYWNGLYGGTVAGIESRRRVCAVLAEEEVKHAMRAAELEEDGATVRRLRVLVKELGFVVPLPEDAVDRSGKQCATVPADDGKSREEGEEPSPGQ